MNKKEQKEYKKEIKEIKFQNLETLFLIFQYSMLNVLESIDNYDKSKKILKDYYNIAREEAMLLRFIESNLTQIDSNELDKVLDMLDEVNEKTVLYLYGFLEDKELDRRSSFFIEYLRFKSLIDTEQYRKEVLSLALSLEDIKHYLSVNNKMWKYIMERTIVTDDESFYGVNIKINNNIVEDFKVFVPHIVNLQTAKINVHEFTHAIDVYKMLGLTYNEVDYEKIAKDTENEFEKEYIKHKLKQNFGTFDKI